MKFGVVVGRFQTPELHEGHLSLLKRAANDNDHLLVFIGVSAIAGTKRNPLDYATRERMLTFSKMRYQRRENSPYEFVGVSIEPIKDRETNEAWSEQLDKLIEDHTKFGDSVTLYGGEDSFLDCYCGKFKNQVRLNTMPRHHATLIREEVISSAPDSSPFFRRGAIYSIGNMRNTVSSTVDVAMIKQIAGHYEKIASVSHPSYALSRRRSERRRLTPWMSRNCSEHHFNITETVHFFFRI